MTIDEFLANKQFSFRKTVMQVDLGAENQHLQEYFFESYNNNVANSPIYKNGMTIDDLIPFTLDLSGIRTFRCNNGFYTVIKNNSVTYINHNDESIEELLRLAHHK